MPHAARRIEKIAGLRSEGAPRTSHRIVPPVMRALASRGEFAAPVRSPRTRCKLAGGGQLVGFNTSGASGPAGPTGAAAATGATGPTGPTGANGALNIETTGTAGTGGPPAEAGTVYTHDEHLDCPSVPYAQPLRGGGRAWLKVNGTRVRLAALVASEDDLEGGWRVSFAKLDGQAFNTNESIDWEISVSCLKAR